MDGAVQPVDAGTYYLTEAEILPHAAKITAGFPDGEYLLIENREPVGLENDIPQGGLAIWHVDETVGTNSNEGFPGQAGWPANGNHYKVALLQADGKYDLEQIYHGNANGRGDSGDLYRAGFNNLLNMNTTPNTDGYQGGNVVPTFNIISQISSNGLTMSFRYSHGTYADPSYAGGNSDGTWQHPFRSFIDAYNNVGSGGTIVLRATDYFEAPLNNLNKPVDVVTRLGAATVH